MFFISSSCDLRRIFEIAEWLDSRAVILLKDDKETLPKLRAELAELKSRLATSPEEPVSDFKCPHCGGTKGVWYSRTEPLAYICDDCGKDVDEEPFIQDSQITEPEWRDLLPSEVICEGDEFQEKQYDPIKNKWYTIYECSMVGKKVSDSDWGRFRTRRPLPKPKLTRASYDEDWNLKLKQEEMPLDAEIASIEWSCAHTAKAIRYLLQQINTLRDEIQKLKQK